MINMYHILYYYYRNGNIQKTEDSFVGKLTDEELVSFCNNKTIILLHKL